MRTEEATETEIVQNPLDTVEELLLTNEWVFHRSEHDELLIEISGRWCHYRVFLVWEENVSALHYSCQMDLKLSPTQRRLVDELLARINERLWVGHFDISAEDNAIVFRHSSLLRGLASVTPEMIEDLFDLGLAECDRYYPSFQLVIWGGKSSDEAIAAAILDPQGEA